jgi:uncharacterized membrane protein
MIKKVFIILFCSAFISLFLTPITVHAQDWGGCVDANGVATLTCIPVVFHNLVNAALIFVGSVSVILIIWGGITFVRSGGDPKQTQHARQIITYAIIGLVLVLSSFFIVFLIAYLTGANCITNFSFTSC